MRLFSSSPSQPLDRCWCNLDVWGNFWEICETVLREMCMAIWDVYFWFCFRLYMFVREGVYVCFIACAFVWQCAFVCGRACQFVCVFVYFYVFSNDFNQPNNLNTQECFNIFYICAYHRNNHNYNDLLLSTGPLRILYPTILTKLQGQTFQTLISPKRWEISYKCEL